MLHFYNLHSLSVCAWCHFDFSLLLFRSFCWNFSFRNNNNSLCIAIHPWIHHHAICVRRLLLNLDAGHAVIMKVSMGIPVISLIKHIYHRCACHIHVTFFFFHAYTRHTTHCRSVYLLHHIINHHINSIWA